jgi:hypothetical protein
VGPDLRARIGQALSATFEAEQSTRAICHMRLPAEADDETIRRHIQATAQRMEQELGEERQLNLFDDEPSEQEEQALPDGPITLGIDGGYVRAAHKEGFFEVIAGRSVVAFRRAADDDVPESKCFGYVQTSTRSHGADCGN